MPKKPYMPVSADAIGLMLVAFDTNIAANGGALATKYKITAPELARIHQANLVWSWFADTLTVARNWAQSLTDKRDSMLTGDAQPAVALPGLPTLPPSPVISAGPPTVPALLEAGFFTFFSSIVSRIKDAENYDIADGTLLGIEGAEIPEPLPSIIPDLTGDLYTSGHPELTCKKGQFQGYTVFLTKPGQPRKMIGFSSTRRYVVEESLPAPGTAEIWIFEVQYRYDNKPFGQFSQPLSLTVRG